MKIKKVVEKLLGNMSSKQLKSLENFLDTKVVPLSNFVSQNKAPTETNKSIRIEAAKEVERTMSLHNWVNLLEEEELIYVINSVYSRASVDGKYDLFVVYSSVKAAEPKTTETLNDFLSHMEPLEGRAGLRDH